MDNYEPFTFTMDDLRTSRFTIAPLNRPIINSNELRGPELKLERLGFIKEPVDKIFEDVIKCQFRKGDKVIRFFADNTFDVDCIAVDEELLSAIIQVAMVLDWEIVIPHSNYISQDVATGVWYTGDTPF